MAAIYSNGGNRCNILGFNFTKRDALSSVYKISMTKIGGDAIHNNRSCMLCKFLMICMIQTFRNVLCL